MSTKRMLQQKMTFRHITVAAVMLSAGAAAGYCCTSAIVSADATSAGRPMLWKHRDTGHVENFIARIPALGSDLGYVALFNSGDTACSEAWIGVNEAGFAVMNTASYNLSPDTAAYKDREGHIMALALKRCHSLSDFETMLDTLPRPMGVQANFGAIDALGYGAYYETDDYGYEKYDLSASTDGIMVRTNFSCSGKCGDGLGRIRYANAEHLLKPYRNNRLLTPEVFTETLSRSFYHSGRDEDACVTGATRVEDLDFIPRRSTSASIVIEGSGDVDNPSEWTMWVVMGYPPCSYVLPVTIDHIPYALLPSGPKYVSPMSEAVGKIKSEIITRHDDGRYYVDLDAIKSMQPELEAKSREGYRIGRRLKGRSVLK